MSVVPRNDRLRPVLLVGLTGGIATGKSTVCGMFRELGIPVVDADAIVHELLASGGDGVRPVIQCFGEAVVAWDGGIDREKLAKRVFSDDAARRQLEALIHPMVIERSQARIHAVADSEDADIVIYDAALLIETGRHESFHRLVVVTAAAETQLLRLVTRNSLSVDDAGARIRSQMPVVSKAALADYVIDNSEHWRETRKRVIEVHRMLQDDAALLICGELLPPRR